MKTSDAIIRGINHVKTIGYAVVGVETVVHFNLNDCAESKDLFIGELRLQGLDTNVGEIELRSELPNDPTQYEVTLKASINTNDSKGFNVVSFNNIEVLDDCQAYFSGVKLQLAKLEVEEATL